MTPASQCNAEVNLRRECVTLMKCLKKHIGLWTVESGEWRVEIGLGAGSQLVFRYRSVPRALY